MAQKQFQSNAHRVAPEEKKVQFEDGINDEDVRLTNEQITKGIDEAREAINAVPLDLIDFEQKLKSKHDELKAAGVTPNLIVKPKFKVPLRKTQKKK